MAGGKVIITYSNTEGGADKAPLKFESGVYIMRYIRCECCQEKIYEDEDGANLDSDVILGRWVNFGVCAGCADMLYRDEGKVLREYGVSELIELYDVEYEEDEPDEIGTMWDEYHEARIEKDW